MVLAVKALSKPRVSVIRDLYQTACVLVVFALPASAVVVRLLQKGHLYFARIWEPVIMYVCRVI